MADRAKAYGFEGVTVDGSDFTEVYLAFKEAVKAARGKKGPKLIELMVSRLTLIPLTMINLFIVQRRN